MTRVALARWLHGNCGRRSACNMLPVPWRKQTETSFLRNLICKACIRRQALSARSPAVSLTNRRCRICSMTSRPDCRLSSSISWSCKRPQFLRPIKRGGCAFSYAYLQCGGGDNDCAFDTESVARRCRLCRALQQERYCCPSNSAGDQTPQGQRRTLYSNPLWTRSPQ